MEPAEWFHHDAGGAVAMVVGRRMAAVILLWIGPFSFNRGLDEVHAVVDVAVGHRLVRAELELVGKVFGLIVIESPGHIFADFDLILNFEIIIKLFSFLRNFVVDTAQV